MAGVPPIPLDMPERTPALPGKARFGKVQLAILV
jgi:hypothetical protein